MKAKLLMLLLATLYLVQTFSKNAISSKATTTEEAFGIDLSHTNGPANWNLVKTHKKNGPIQFIILRATMGDDRKDRMFRKNYRAVKKQGFIVGAYHYYDPNESSVKQTRNFLATATLVKGDMVPVVDIEKLSKRQSVRSLLKGVKFMLLALEQRYGKKPMIYTSCRFYRMYLAHQGFEGYQLWIASYRTEERNKQLIESAKIHQFAENLSIKGIHGHVDGNKAKNLEEIIL